MTTTDVVEPLEDLEQDELDLIVSRRLPGEWMAALGSLAKAIDSYRSEFE